MLSPEEYSRLPVYCLAYLKPVVKPGCHTGMRQGEILGLAWGRVDSKEGFIRLNPENAGTNEARLAPLSRALVITFSGHDKGEEITY